MAEPHRVTLVGDGIENPANALALLHAAAMFDAACRFRDTKGLAAALAVSRPGAAAPATPADPTGPVAAPTPPTPSIAPAPPPTAATPASPAGAPRAGAAEPAGPRLAFIEDAAALQALHGRIVACDNLPGARDVYGHRAGRDFALVVGNERRGLSHAFAAAATEAVQVPMVSRRINCLNVAAAAAVALYYLRAAHSGGMAVRRDPRGHRPELLLLDPADHFELGSALRSAAALGWERVFVADGAGVWFGCERGVRAEGRAAARRGRNDIVVVPFARRSAPPYPRLTVVTRRRELGVPLHRARLDGGARQMLLIPDESAVDVAAVDWSRLGREVELAHLDLPVADSRYRFHLPASIALAEASRQVGRGPADRVAAAAARRPVYDAALDLLAAAGGEAVSWVELQTF
jgi:hypothetical protein